VAAKAAAAISPPARRRHRKLPLVDEPSVGLAPIWSAVRDQRNETALPAHRADGRAEFHPVHGKIAFEGRSMDELNNNDLIKKFYLGL
jgi:branched-chain amino acid transport system ATP-binding protein